jgi:hypothetical protein
MLCVASDPTHRQDTDVKRGGKQFEIFKKANLLYVSQFTSSVLVCTHTFLFCFVELPRKEDTNRQKRDKIKRGAYEKKNTRQKGEPMEHTSCYLRVSFF